MYFSKSKLFATLVSFLFLYFAGWFFYGTIAADFFEIQATNNVSKNPMNLGILTLGCFIISFLFTTIYEKWSQGNHTIKQGFCYGLSIGMLFFGMSLLMFGQQDLMTLIGVLADGLWTLIYYGMAGLLVSLVYKSTSKPLKK